VPEFYGLVISGEAEVITVAQKLEALRNLAESRACEGVDGNPFSCNSEEIWASEIFDILEGRIS